MWWKGLQKYSLTWWRCNNILVSCQSVSSGHLIAAEPGTVQAETSAQIDSTSGDSSAGVPASTARAYVAPTPPVPQPASKPSESPFKLPADPRIPHDLSIIAEMVAQQQVVGALPKLDMSLAEKRRLVEESMRKGKAKATAASSSGIATTVASTEDGTPGTLEPAPSSTVNDAESDSDSSSEFESSSEEESDDDETAPAAQNLAGVPHAALKRELDGLIGRPGAPDDDSEAEDESDDEAGEEGVEFEYDDSPLPSPKGRKIDLSMFELEEEEAEGGGPIMSMNEVPLPPVAMPPMEKLPEGEGMSLAGEVVSWMKEKKVESWLATQTETKEEGSGNGQGAALAEAAVEGEGDKTGAASKEEGELEETTSEAISTGQEATTSLVESAADTVESSPAKSTATQPKFNSAGTVVIRAMQSRPGAADEGWLEEGSVVCWEDGRVLGTVSLYYHLTPFFFNADI